MVIGIHFCQLGFFRIELINHHGHIKPLLLFDNQKHTETEAYAKAIEYADFCDVPLFTRGRISHPHGYVGFGWNITQQCDYLSGRMPKPIQYPKICPFCFAKAVHPASIEHRSEQTYEGVKYLIDIMHLEVHKCSRCEGVYFDLTTDETIDEAFRRQANLLTAKQIISERERLKMSQKELALAVHVTEETVISLEQRLTVQSRNLDNMLRTHFD